MSRQFHQFHNQLTHPVMYDGFDGPCAIKNIWCTKEDTYISVANGDVYAQQYGTFEKFDTISNKNISFIVGYNKSVAIDLDDMKTYGCSENYPEHTFPILNQKYDILNILKKYKDHDINIQYGELMCSIAVKTKYLDTKDINYMICNLYESIFGNNNTFSDILFIN